MSRIQRDRIRQRLRELRSALQEVDEEGQAALSGEQMATFQKAVLEALLDLEERLDWLEGRMVSVEGRPRVMGAVGR